MGHRGLTIKFKCIVFRGESSNASGPPLRGGYDTNDIGPWQKKRASDSNENLIICIIDDIVFEQNCFGVEDLA